MDNQHIKLVDSIWNSITYRSFTNGLELTITEWAKPFFYNMALPESLQENQERWINDYQVFKNDLDKSMKYIPSSEDETQMLIIHFERILNHVAREISLGSSLALSNWFKRHFLSQKFQNSMDDWRLILQYTFFPCQRHSSIPSPPLELLTIFSHVEPLIWSNIEATRLELLKIPKKLSITSEQIYIDQEIYGSSIEEVTLNDDFLYGSAWQIYNTVARESTRKALMSIAQLIEPSERKLVFRWFDKHSNHLLEYCEIDKIEKAICIANGWNL